MNFLKRLREEENGVGAIEVILILVVLIGLVIIFKSNLQALMGTIFEKIQTQSGTI